MDKKEIFQRIFDIHVQSKTTGTQFHKDTEKAYELAFDYMHLTSEMEQNLDEAETTDSCESWQEVYNLLQELKSMNEKTVKENEDIGYDDELRGLARRLTDICWTFRQYTTKAEEEEETEQIAEKSIEDIQPTKSLFNLK